MNAGNWENEAHRAQALVSAAALDADPGYGKEASATPGHIATLMAPKIYHVNWECTIN